MALTLIEAAKRHSGDVLRANIIEMYARSSEILRTLPFTDIAGNALAFSREDILPGVAFRGVNEAYVESTGVLNRLVEPLAIVGGDIDVDVFLTKTMGMDQRTVQESMKIKSIAHSFTHTFIKGDSTANPRQFDGLQARIPVGSNQLIDAGATNGGDPLSLAKLDEAIDLVNEPTHLIMNKTMRRRLSTAAHATTVSGFITYDPDEFGRRLTFYAGLPVIVADEDNAGNQILPFTEAAPADAAATTTSIYVVAFREGMLTGIQNGVMDVRDLGEQQAKPAWRTRVEWYASFVPLHGKSVARLRGITNAPVVA